MKLHFKTTWYFDGMCRHFISGSVYMIVYHPEWNLVSLKMTGMKSIPALSFKHTCILNATYSESALIHFVSGKLSSHKISCRFEISFRSKWPLWNPYRFEFHFASVHVNTSKEVTQHRSEIFNRIKISYRFEFIPPLMWTCSNVKPEIWLESRLTSRCLSPKNDLFNWKVLFLWLANIGVEPHFSKISRLKLQKLLKSCWPSETES